MGAAPVGSADWRQYGDADEHLRPRSPALRCGISGTADRSAAPAHDWAVPAVWRGVDAVVPARCALSCGGGRGRPARARKPLAGERDDDRTGSSLTSAPLQRTGAGAVVTIS